MFKNTELSDLTLYHFHACPYCVKTRAIMEDLGINIEKRDIRLDSNYKVELLAHGGKIQVPCLRVEKQNENTKWIYESEDVIDFLISNADILIN